MAQAGRAAGNEAVKIIRARTVQGQFARQGSSGVRARRYNPDYAKSVGKAAGGPVDLTVTGGLLGSLVGDAKFEADGRLRISVDHSTADAKRKKVFLQDIGVGPTRIKRRYLYLNKTEIRRDLRIFYKSLGGR
jgi:hypothetical protein